MTLKAKKSTEKAVTVPTTAARMAAPAVAAPLAGVRYQVRFFWLQALPMLSRGEVERAEMEHREADAVDDVAIFYRPPGKNDGGELTDVDYFQAKYHVGQSGTIDADFFTDAARTGTATPLLKRLADTWSAESVAHPNCRLTFITTWQWNPTDPMHAMISGGGGHLKGEFLSMSVRSNVGKIREHWFRVSGLGRPDFERFVSRLRFYAPWPTYLVESHLRDRMQTAGLSIPPLDRELNALDDLGNHLLETGRIVWRADDLRALLKREKLLDTTPNPRRPVVSVRSFKRFSGLGLEEGDVNMDLTDLFDGRNPRSSDAWTTVIPARLLEQLPYISRLRQPIELALDCHLSVAWHFGTLLDSKSGIQTIVRQKVQGRGSELWETASTPAASNEWVLEHDSGDGEGVVVIASLTHPIKDDVQRSIPNLGLGSVRIVHLTLPTPSLQAVRDGAHAVSLAASLANTIRDLTAKRPARHVHLFFSAPVSFAFLLGQHSGVLGPATVYEFDFNGTRTYAPGMTSPSN